MHSPMAVEASYLGNGVGSVEGKFCFDARKMLNRPALLLVDGTLYLAFISHLDGEPKFDYHGWIVAYNAKILKQTAVVNTTPMESRVECGRVAADWRRRCATGLIR